MAAKIALRDMTDFQLRGFLDAQQELYNELCAREVAVDLSLDAPSRAQLDLSNALLNLPGTGACRAADGTDVRLGGGLQGLLELRQIFGELLRIPAANLVAAGNSSLALMHDVLVDALLHGLPDGEGPWYDQSVRFICPVPGNGRQFAICEHLDIDMIPVELGPDGPDVARVAGLMASDARIKGMWMTPIYSNPTGITYSDQTLRAILEAPAAAPDFRIWVDDGYALQHLMDAESAPVPLLDWAAQAGNPDRVFLFASTSRITFAGAGVAFLGASQLNLRWFLDHAGVRSIGPDKVNQLRHMRFLGDAEGVRALLRQHRELLVPKFKIVDDTLKRRMGELHVARWTKPKGGYFITLVVPDGCASRVVELAAAAGITLSPAGDSYPYGRDPLDRVVVIAPSYPSRGELSAGMDALATCVLLAVAEKLLSGRV